MMTTTEAPVKPVPKVPASAWRWPPVWPFPPDFTEVIENTMPVERLLSDKSEEMIAQHLRSFIEPAASVLELSTEAASLLPQDLRYARREQTVVDEAALKSAQFSLPYEDGAFDAVLVSAGIEFVIDPRDAFKEVWRVLRPGGRCFVSFLSKFPGNKLQPLKMWTTMTDEQKIWIVGSYYHYSAGEGFVDIEGYDLHSSSDKQLNFAKEPSVDVAAYVVQATKSTFVPLEENAMEHVAVRLAGARHMYAEDRKYVALRSATRLDSIVDKADYVHALITKIPQIYSILEDVQEIVVPTPVKAMLATYIVENWSNSEEQRKALKQGLGLLPSTDDPFWAPIGAATKGMRPKDKVVFLTDIIPLFGTGRAAAQLQLLPTLLPEVIVALKGKLPDSGDDEIQLLATELVVTDFLTSSVTDAAARLMRFIAASPKDTLASILDGRKKWIART